MTITAHQKAIARRCGERHLRDNKPFDEEAVRDSLDQKTNGECDTTELDILVSIARHRSIPPTWR